MDTMVFPEGTTGYLLDAFARRPLWEDGLGTSVGAREGRRADVCAQIIGTRACRRVGRG